MLRHSSPPVPAHGGTSLLFTVGGGVRLGLPGDYASPTVVAAVGASFGRWDLVVSGQWDALHEPLSSTAPDGLELSSFTVAAVLGRREPVRNMSILYGAQLGLSLFDWQFPAFVATTAEEAAARANTTLIDSKYEQQLAAYVAVVLPADSKIRFRPGLMVDVLPSRIGEKLDVWAPIPWWSTALTLGVEVDLP